ncbi:glycosyltransferase family 4 protein [Fulvivirga sp. M361]|uniref:glycosyltransferase family 4 protein n=1 Tax=Fulvivirga sp. M361 TaxID=2594266 RepID=UPI0011798BBD|nr:glycosyltransferase family 1 protein [Fulvivirga sp. M361]TRX50233.1 glycosyltransferase family 4 protein [Fulvivirga sp. M361]
MKITYFFRRPRSGFNSIEELFSGIIQGINKVRETDIIKIPLIGASPLRVIYNIFFAVRNKGELNHITGDAHYLAIGLGKNTVLTIHDVYSAIRGNIFKKVYIKLFWFIWPARCVGSITTISEFSKQELIKTIPFAADKIKVVHNPYRYDLLKYEKKSADTSLGVEPVKIMLVGTKPNKNLERTIRALQNARVELCILGKLTPAQIQLLQSTSTQYVNRYNLSYEDVIRWYLQCDLLSFMSTYEGFGMPIVEAQVLGLPVVTSNLGAMREVAKDGACLVDPYDELDMRKGIEKVISHKEYRKELIQKGIQNANRFDPHKITNQYMSVYDEMGERFNLLS